jgi:hypothetical protein
MDVYITCLCISTGQHRGGHHHHHEGGQAYNAGISPAKRHETRYEGSLLFARGGLI